MAGIVRSLMAYAVPLLACFALAGCSGKDGTAQGRVIAVSIEPQRCLLERIAGGRYDVVTVLPPGTDPETFEPAMSVRMRLADADAYMMAGHLPFEATFGRSLKGDNPRLLTMDTSEGIDIITGTHVHSDGHGHSHDADPHTWTSARNAKIMARNMLRGLCRLDPEGADVYKKNYSALVLWIDSLDSAISQRLEHVKGCSFVVWHPSLSYFARDYGLNQISVGSEGKEATARALQRSVDRAVADSVRVFFFQREFDSRQADAVNRHIGARMVAIDPLGYDWEGQMNLIADELACP